MAKTWDGTSNDWDNAADWSPNGLPTSTDDVTINGGSPSLKSGDAGLSANSITLNGGVLTISDPGVTQSVVGSVTVGAAQLQIDIFGGEGGSNVSIGGALNVSGNVQIGSNN